MANKLRSAQSQFVALGAVLAGAAEAAEHPLHDWLDAHVAGLNPPALERVFLFSVAYLLCAVVVARLLAWLFERVLWRIGFSELDFNGTWEYENAYDGQGGNAAPPPNRGDVNIEQDLDSITFIEGERSSKEVRWESLAGRLFDEDRARFIHVYEVRYQNPRTAMWASKRSIERVECVRNQRWWATLWLKRRPVEVQARFWNVLMSDPESDEFERARGVRPQLLTGQCTYRRTGRW